MQSCALLPSVLDPSGLATREAAWRNRESGERRLRRRLTARLGLTRRTHDPIPHPLLWATRVQAVPLVRSRGRRRSSSSRRVRAGFLLTSSTVNPQALSDEPSDQSADGPQAEKIRAVSDFAPIKERVRKYAFLPPRCLSGCLYSISSEDQNVGKILFVKVGRTTSRAGPFS